jgi:cell division protein FtsQ
LARKSSSTAVQEELYPVSHARDDVRDYDSRGHDDSARSRRESFDDSRIIDLEEEQQSPFLRGQKRVSARRGTLPKKTAVGLKWAALALIILGILSAAGAELYSYGKHNWRFRIDSSDQIEVAGAQHVPHAQIMEVMGGDIGRNIFFIPLAHRKQQLEQIPWVESASVMRFVPNHLRIEIHERTPIAFARIGAHISLIDAGGNLMDLEPGPKHKYSFPVITGMNAGEPLSVRAARMRNYNDLIQQLDFSGAHYSQDLSEVDIADPEDVKVVTADPSGRVLVHLGNANYLQRYRVYVTHVEAWRQQFEKLESVDLRFDGQIIVNPDLQGLARQPALTKTAAKAALAAGVKNAAIVNYEKFVNRPAPPVGKPAQPKAKSGAKAFVKSGTRAAPKAASKPVVKHTAHQTATKWKAKSVATRHGATPSKAGSTAAKTRASQKSVQQPSISAGKTQTNAPKPISVASSSTAVAGSQKKPSPAIAKEAPQN